MFDWVEKDLLILLNEVRLDFQNEIIFFIVYKIPENFIPEYNFLLSDQCIKQVQFNQILEYECKSKNVKAATIIKGAVQMRN